MDDEGHRHRRDRSQGGDQPEMLGTLCRPGQLSLPKLRVEHGLPGAEDLGARRRSLRQEGIVAAEFPEEVFLGRIDMGDCDRPGALLPEDVEGTPIGQRGDGEPGDLLDREFVVERGRRMALAWARKCSASSVCLLPIGMARMLATPPGGNAHHSR